VVARVSLLRRGSEQAGNDGLLAALARSQTIAAASTALYRNQLVQSGVSKMASNERDGSSDFDFYFGRWYVRNERLRQRLVGSGDWEQFEATQECRPIPGGIGNIDDFVTKWSGGFIGMSLRLFNRQTKRWSIYWASNRDGILQAPVIGAFADGVGRFEGADIHEGRPVIARFLWSDITPTSACWQQALSADGGQSWETNWRMQMTRIS
jgi:hypothetical protein